MLKTLNNSKQNYVLLSFLGIVTGIFISYQMRWLGDDIFIGLRYVKNFVNGNGLVYNIGEKVEGYTDFLWLILISFFSLLKFDVATISMALGILFSSGTLILFSVIGYKISVPKNKFIFPFITFALVFNYDYNVWATSGLEVSFVTFLLSTAFYIYFFTELTTNKRLVFTGLFICLGLLTRPDVMIILMCANLFLLISNLYKAEHVSTIIKSLGLFNLSVVVIYLPYFLWRYNYYGFIFPNTYYDKLGNESAFAQGFYYLWLYFKCHFSSFLIFLPVLFFFPLLIKNGFTKTVLKKEYAPLIAATGFVFIYLLFFVAKVGGDFMYARFIIPCVPFIYFIIVYFFTLTNFKKLNLLLLCVLSLSVIETLIRKQLFVEIDEKGKDANVISEGIADERFVYLYWFHIEDEIKHGKELNEALKGINYKAIIFGAQARFAYYADFNYCMEWHGLTDTLIAHSAITKRGRIGHEKHAAIDYVESKGINFAFNAGALKKDDYRQATIKLPSGTINVEILTYNNDIINKLTKKFGKDFQYIHFPTFLDAYINNVLPTITSYKQLEQDYQKFNAYYFKNNTDIKRKDVFLTTLEKLKS